MEQLLRRQRFVEQSAISGNTTIPLPPLTQKAVSNNASADLLSARQVVDLGWPLVDAERKHAGSLSKSTEEHWMVVEQVLKAACEVGEERVAKACLKQLRDEFGAASCRVRSLNALLMESEGQVAEAIAEYRDVLTQELLVSGSGSSNILGQWIRKRLIVCQMEQRQPLAEIIKSLNAYLNDHMADTEAWEQLYQIYWTETHYDQAAYCAEELIVLRPSNWGYHLKYAEVQFMRGDWQLAKKYFCHVLDFNPDNARAMVGIKKCLKQQTDKTALDIKLDQLVTDRLQDLMASASSVNSSIPADVREAIKYQME